MLQHAIEQHLASREALREADGGAAADRRLVVVEAFRLRCGVLDQGVELLHQQLLQDLPAAPVRITVK